MEIPYWDKFLFLSKFLNMIVYYISNNKVSGYNSKEKPTTPIGVYGGVLWQQKVLKRDLTL